MVWGWGCCVRCWDRLLVVGWSIEIVLWRGWGLGYRWVSSDGFRIFRQGNVFGSRIAQAALMV